MTDTKNIGKIEKIIKKSSVKITDKFIEKLHIVMRGSDDGNTFYLNFLKKFGNNVYNLSDKHLAGYLINVWTPDMKVVKYYIKNTNELNIDVNYILQFSNIEIFRTLMRETIIDTDLIKKEDSFVTLLSKYEMNSSNSVKVLLDYFKPEYTEELFAYACIFQCSSLIDHFMNNDIKKITKKDFDMACKSGHFKLVEHLLNSNKGMKISENNIIDYAFSSNQIHMNTLPDLLDNEKPDDQPRQLIGKMISIVKIRKDTKFMLMDLELYEKDEEYKLYLKEINVIADLIYDKNEMDLSVNKVNDESPFHITTIYSISEANKLSKLSEALLKYDLPRMMFYMTQIDINKYNTCLMLSNSDIRVLNYLEYKYNFKPTYYQIIGCSVLMRKMHLLNKYYPCKENS